MANKTFFVRMIMIILISHHSTLTNSQESGDLRRCQRQCQSTMMSGQLQLCLLDCYQGFSYVMYRTSRSYNSVPDGDMKSRKDNDQEALFNNLDSRDKKSVFVKLGKSSKTSLRSLTNPSTKFDLPNRDRMTKKSMEEFSSVASIPGVENYSESIDRPRSLEMHDLNKVFEEAVRELDEESKTGLLTKIASRNRQRLAEAEPGKRRNGFVRIGRWFDYSDVPSFRGESKEERFHNQNIAEAGKRRTGFVRIG